MLNFLALVRLSSSSLWHRRRPFKIVLEAVGAHCRGNAEQLPGMSPDIFPADFLRNAVPLRQHRSLSSPPPSPRPANDPSTSAIRRTVPATNVYVAPAPRSRGTSWKIGRARHPIAWLGVAQVAQFSAPIRESLSSLLKL
jgi:hypothetical protein